MSEKSRSSKTSTRASKKAAKKVAKKGSKRVAKKAAKKVAKKAARKTAKPEVTAAMRHEMIEVAAYYRAESRNFQDGDPVADWLHCEKEVDAAIRA